MQIAVLVEKMAGTGYHVRAAEPFALTVKAVTRARGARPAARQD